MQYNQLGSARESVIIIYLIVVRLPIVRILHSNSDSSCFSKEILV
jgi:hypothetical protein